MLKTLKTKEQKEEKTNEKIENLRIAKITLEAQVKQVLIKFNNKFFTNN